MAELQTDVLIVGGGTGGVAAAMAATAMGCSVVMTEETDWLGGQLTSQIVPPDENPWIESFGCTGRYRAYREGVRQYYRDHYPLTPEARASRRISPGGGHVGKLCHEPRIGVAVIDQMLAYARSSGMLHTMLRHVPIAADVDGDRVRSITVRSLETGRETTITAAYILDATELGDVLPLAKVEYVSGAESKAETGELHAFDGPADAEDVQSFTWCFAMGYDPTPGADYIIDKPAMYEQWRDSTPRTAGDGVAHVKARFDNIGPATSGKRQLFPDTPDQMKHGPLWLYRRIIGSSRFPRGVMPQEVTVVNWPHNDYIGGNIIDKHADEVARHLDASRQLSLSLLYYLQTEVERPDGGSGYPGLHLRPEITGTDDGLAKYPYIRESRRIRAAFTVLEQHIGATQRGSRPGEVFDDTVGIGCYAIDLHDSHKRSGAWIGSGVFHIPLGALLPRRVRNVLAAGKNLGVTHVTNGCYRLHPVEWNVGESAGALAAFCVTKRTEPHAVRENEALLREYQDALRSQGVELLWPYPDGIPGA